MKAFKSYLVVLRNHAPSFFCGVGELRQVGVLRCGRQPEVRSSHNHIAKYLFSIRGV